MKNTSLVIYWCFSCPSSCCLIILQTFSLPWSPHSLIYIFFLSLPLLFSFSPVSYSSLSFTLQVIRTNSQPLTSLSHSHSHSHPHFSSSICTSTSTGLNCNLIISRFPAGAPVTDRAIPVAIFRFDLEAEYLMQIKIYVFCKCCIIPLTCIDSSSFPLPCISSFLSFFHSSFFSPSFLLPFYFPTYLPTSFILLPFPPHPHLIYLSSYLHPILHNSKYTFSITHIHHNQFP